MISRKLRAASFSVLTHVLGGLAAASVTVILIYFKQKPVLHYSVILAGAAVLYWMSIWLIKKPIRVHVGLRSAFTILFFILCLGSSQLLYQVRPYTFYITGFALTAVLSIVASALVASSESLKSKPWVISAFLLGFGIGSLVPQTILYYMIGAFSVSIVFLFLLTTGSNLLYKTGIVAVVFLSSFAYISFSVPIILYDDQPGYEDKILFTGETQFHKLVITQWKDDHWFFIDKLKNLSSIDAYLYYEPMVHSVFNIAEANQKVLILGSENGAMMHEILKYDAVRSAEVVSYDTVLRNLARELPYFTQLNKRAYENEKLQIIRKNLTDYISGTNQKYDLVFIDLPDPRTVESNQYYTLEFYRLIGKLLNDDGFMITQAGSPYFASEAYYTIGRTLISAGFSILPLHNQILTLGEWGWFVCSKSQSSAEMKTELLSQKEIPVETIWFDEEAAKLVSSFGKTHEDTVTVQINSLDNPIVYRYYLKGTFDF